MEECVFVPEPGDVVKVFGNPKKHFVLAVDEEAAHVICTDLHRSSVYIRDVFKWEQQGDYERLATEIGALVDTKQAQYGDAITKVGDVLAIMYPDGIKPEQYVGMGLTVRVLDKLMRVANGDQGEESAWRDVAGYGLLGEMQSKKKEDPAT